MFPYEKLEVYKKAFRMNEIIYEILKGNKTIPTYLKSQLGRAALSICLNIAEGSGRLTNKDRKNFMVTARGSVFECAAILNFLHNRKEINESKHSELLAGYDEVSRMLFFMINNLSVKIGEVKV
jgi:four helix bundle protein